MALGELSKKPSPYQARVMRLMAEGFMLGYNGYLEVPKEGDKTEHYARRKEQVGSGLRHHDYLVNRTLLSMRSKGILEHHSEKYEWTTASGEVRISTNRYLVLTDAAKAWLERASPEDFISPDRDPSKRSPFTADEILDMLKERYSPPRHAFFREFTLGTGAWGNRRIDAFVMSLWPSDGFTRRAFEVKISRSDFLREMKDERKRASAEKFANEFWIAAPMNLIDPDELPENLGLIEARLLGDDGRQLRIKKRAEATNTPDLPMWIIASIVRRVDKIEHDHLLAAKAKRIALGYEVMVQNIEDVKAGTKTPEQLFRTVKYWLTDNISESEIKNYLARYNSLND